MSFKSSTAQLLVLDPTSLPMMGGGHFELSQPSLEVSEEPHDHTDHDDIGINEGMTPNDHPDDNLEVSEQGDIQLVVEELPGAPAGTKDPEPPMEVQDEPLKVEDQAPASDEKKDKKTEKWDWESKGPHGFVAWIKERISSVPKHSGYDSAGLERAVAYLDRIDNEISKAMRMDLDGDLDANKIEEVRAQIDDGIARLHSRLDKVKKNKKSSRKKKASEDMEAVGFTKEAQKITGVAGIYIVAPLFISRLARVCINGMVSAGHDIEDMYKRQSDRWKLTDREQAELQQLLFDMGYPMRQDRGFMPEDQLEVTDSNGMDHAANFPG